MKIDFEYIKKVSDKLHEAFVEDGDLSTQFDKGSMVHSINFDPQTGHASAHVQWPYFRNLVANEGDYPATYTRVQQSSKDEPWLYWNCDVLGVKIVTCMDKSDIVKELEALELPEDCEVDFSDDIEHLFTLWQNCTGWNLCCP